MKDLVDVKEVRCDRLASGELACFIENKNPDGSPCLESVRAAKVLKTVAGDATMPDQAWLAVRVRDFCDKGYHTGKPIEEVLTISELRRAVVDSRLPEMFGFEPTGAGLQNPAYRACLVCTLGREVVRRRTALELAIAV